LSEDQKVQHIVDKISADADEKAEELISEAKSKSKEIEEKAKVKAENRRNEIIKEAEKKARQEKNKVIANAKLDAKKKKYRVREELIEKVISRVLNRAQNLEDDEYAKILKNLAIEACRQLPGNEFLLKSDEDGRKLLQEMSLEDKLSDSKDMQVSITIEDSYISERGIIASTKDGVASVDKTFRNIVSRNRKNIRKEINKILFESESI